MKPEHKFIPLSELKVSTDGAGTIEGYRAVFGEIDSGGDIIVPGAFKDCIPEYLHSGFTAESHDWDFSKSVGFPIEAKEDGHGWFVKSQFYSTPDAQNIRTKAKERMEAGKQVGFSFGYKTDDYATIEQKDFKDQLPQFIKADRLEENMKKAQQFSRIRILKKVSAIEDSLVTSPMNKLAGATAVKSEGKADTPPPAEKKGMFEDELEERTERLYFLYDVLCCALYKADMLSDMDPAFDMSAALDEILGEFSLRVKNSYLDPEEMTDTEMDDMGTMADSSPISFKGGSLGELRYAKNAEMVLGAVDAFANKGAAITGLLGDLVARRKNINELRETKTGATYSAANLAHMKRIHDAMKKTAKVHATTMRDMADLIAKAEPTDSSSTNGKSDEPELDGATLRAQSLKAQSLALSALN
jgi:HK97 family phage prohead protease